jgi:hypothetical protein
VWPIGEQPPARDDYDHAVLGWRGRREICNPRGKTAREEFLIDDRDLKNEMD